MIKTGAHIRILSPTDLGFENDGVFNPAIYKEPHTNTVHIFYRAVRHGNYSSIGYCQLDGPTSISYRAKTPLLIPERKYEMQGMEDPRITNIGKTFYLTYSAYDGTNVLGAIATSRNLQAFHKQGTITPQFSYEEYNRLIECAPSLSDKYLLHYKFFKMHGLNDEAGNKLWVWDKNIMLFPKKFDGKFALLHRIHPGIQLAYFRNFDELNHHYWRNHLMHLNEHIVMDPLFDHESSHIGAGAPPIETPEGWLLIYHAAATMPSGTVYHAAAALLDLHNPRHVLARLPYPLLTPKEDWELDGIVDNVIFPTGTALFDDELYIYYGAADQHVGVANVSLSGLLNELKQHQI